MSRDFDLLHFDTNDNNCTFTGSTGNAYDVSFKLNTTYKRIRKITLASLEFPIVFTNIRNENTSNIFKLRIGSVDYNLTLANTNYTSIQTLLTDINNQLSLIGTAQTRPTLSLGNRTSGNNMVRISIPSANTIQLFDSILVNQVLGFPKNVYSGIRAPETNILGSYSFNLNYDNFLILYLNIPSTCTSSGNKLISYKIPVNAVSGMVYYLGQNNTFEQSIIVSDQNYVLSDIRVQVFDRFGYPIIQALDYTFSLALYYHM
jgi:hypothetical protein